MKNKAKITRKIPKPIVWSYGGGVQSVAILVAISKGILAKPEFVGIVDTDREGTATWEYQQTYSKALMDELGLRFEVIPHNLAKVDLYRNETLLIPAYTQKGKLPTFCSNEWKQRVIRRRLRELGYGSSKPVICWLGMSSDEVGRLKQADVKWIEHRWPLAMDLTWNRETCIQVIVDYGLPEPPQSSCWMCPHRRNKQWRNLRDNYPKDWEQAIELDEMIRQQDKQGGVYLHHSRQPLATAELDSNELAILPLFGEVDGCDSGYCWS